MKSYRYISINLIIIKKFIYVHDQFQKSETHYIDKLHSEIYFKRLDRLWQWFSTFPSRDPSENIKKVCHGPRIWLGKLVLLVHVFVISV